MRIDREALKAQQRVLKHLKYYNGAIDGIWSRKSIEAKIAFERSGKYNPAIPNTGMPFDLNSKLPAGLLIKNGYLYVEGMDENEVAITTTTPPPSQQVVVKEVATTTPPPQVEQKKDEVVTTTTPPPSQHKK